MLEAYVLATDSHVSLEISLTLELVETPSSAMRGLSPLSTSTVFNNGGSKV